MLTSARPLFHRLPGTYADPLGLADQQAPGTTSLVVAHYPAGDEAGPTYDAFVTASGAVVAVARTTPDYRFPIAPAVAVRRFLDAREHGAPPVLSLYELDPPDGARFLESAFFAECLKLHVDGAGSAALVADQLARSGCRAGLLEVNDFSDPDAPRLHLVEWAAEGGPDLAGLLADTHGRVLLYDREKNRAVAADRAGAGDPLAAVAEAERLAAARRHAPDFPDGPASPLTPPLTDGASTELSRTVEDALRQRHEPQTSEAADPHATGLAALVAELQGAPLPTPRADPSPGDAVLSSPAPQPIEEPPLSGDEDEVSDSADAAPEHSTAADAPSPIPSERQRANPPSLPPQAPPHPLAKPLDALRTEVYDLFEDAVGQERALAHDAHVVAEDEIPSPVPAEHVAAYLRALLTADPPRRWHFYKRSRAKCYEAVAARLLAFHGAHGHDTRDEARQAVHEIAQLWARIHQ